jgi:glutamine amidotransferase-like uncharacterized protein
MPFSDFFLRLSAYLGGLFGNGYFTAERAEIRREPQRKPSKKQELAYLPGFAQKSTQSTHILRFLIFSLRLSAYLGGVCGNGYFTAERAEIRRGPQRRPSKKQELAYLLGFAQKNTQNPHILRFLSFFSAALCVSWRSLR